VDATLTPIDNWQTYLSYSYNDAKIIEVSGRDAAILAAGPSAPGYKEVFGFHNAPLQMSAPHLADIWTRYDFVRGRMRGLYIGGGANLAFHQTLDPDTPPAYRQTYALYNVMAGYQLRWLDLPVTLEFYGKNLANEHYRPSQSTRSRPRELGGLLSVRF
jgi:iron complex outermembrane receptor protein